MLGGLWQVGGLGPMGLAATNRYDTESPKQIVLMYDLLLLWGDLTFLYFRGLAVNDV